MTSPIDPAPPSRTTARGRATRKRIIDATIELVGRVGYANTTTRAIAAAADVAEGTLYRHFPDKAGILLAAVQDAAGPVDAWMQELVRRAGEGTVAGNLSQALEQLASLRQAVLPLEVAMLTDPDLQRIRSETLASGPPPGPPRWLAEYLTAEQRLGRIRGDVVPQDVAITLLSILFGLATSGLATGTELVAALHNAVALISTAICAPTDQPRRRDRSRT